MRPYPGTLTQYQRVHNYRLSRARRAIENSFGILVARWRVFLTAINALIENVEMYAKAGMVLSLVVLHNYLLQTENALYRPSGFVDSENSNGEITGGHWRETIKDDVIGFLQIANVRGSRHNPRKFSIENFKASDGCLRRWKKRNNVAFKTISGELNFVTPEMVDVWSETSLPTLLHNYDLKDIYNPDEFQTKHTNSSQKSAQVES